ncbi:MAG TPA: shikimate dehydrogenase [Pseudogracilibacillus sp.]|nr:shikimate dehydrogenase [Pseudogracilibacillus sp.]
MSFSFGLIGYPVQHSLSPWIHKQFLQRTNQEGTYKLFEIHPESFKEEVQLLRNESLNGFNVTVPYKEKIIPFLDEIDPYAKKIGAVNTVLCKNNKWIGYNTDGIGYVRALESKFPALVKDKEKNILLLGAGGAAKGIFHALIDKGYQHIHMANRTVAKAEELTKEITTSTAISIETASNHIMEYDMIIHTSSVGMKPNVDEVIISFTQLKQDAIVSDIVYQPLMTKLLQNAKQVGANIHFGHTMLLYQALYAFEIWTNLSPSMEQLDKELQQVLEG